MSRSVLIVDDEQHIRLLIEQTLEELSDDGVELYTASDGEEALDVRHDALDEHHQGRRVETAGEDGQGCG